MYGVHELLLHIMYVNKREGLPSLKYYGADKVVFFVLAFCYRYGHDIQYDMMFEKSAYGATCQRLVKSKYKNIFERGLNLDYALPIDVLEQDENVDKMIVHLIKVANQDFNTLPIVIRGSEPYLRDKGMIESITNNDSYTKFYPYWTKGEIVELLSSLKDDQEDKGKHVVIDNRIALNKRTYLVMEKFLRLNGRKATESFTREEIMTLHGLPYHLIRSIDENGCYHNEKLDN